MKYGHVPVWLHWGDESAMGCYAAYSHHANWTWHMSFLIHAETDQGELGIMNMIFMNLPGPRLVPSPLLFDSKPKSPGPLETLSTSPAPTLSVKQERRHLGIPTLGLRVFELLCNLPESMDFGKSEIMLLCSSAQSQDKKDFIILSDLTPVSDDQNKIEDKRRYSTGWTSSTYDSWLLISQTQ